MKHNKQMTIQDLYNILMAHAKDPKIKEMSLVVLDSTNACGATMDFNDAIWDRNGKKSMEKLVDRINEFFDKNDEK